MQLLWFLDSSNPGRHSQATPPLGVSLQMWAQPWSLFMQLMPSAKQDKCNSISILGISVCRQESNQISPIYTQPTACYFWEGSTALEQSVWMSLKTRKAESPILQTSGPQGFSSYNLLCAHILWLQGQKATSLDFYSICILIPCSHFTSAFIKPFIKNTSWLVPDKIKA